jgi:hypothetical protein
MLFIEILTAGINYTSLERQQFSKYKKLCHSGLALKNPPKKTHPKNPKKPT